MERGIHTVTAGGEGVLSAAARDVKVGVKAAERSVVQDTAILGTKETAKTIGHSAGLWAIVAVPAVTAAFSQWDHVQEKHRITGEYEREISARLGKSPEEIKTSDMEKVARENPAIGEAVHRSRLRRNLSIGVTLAATLAVLAMGPLGLLAPITGVIGAAIPGFVTAGLASAATAVGFSAAGLGSVSGMGAFIAASVASGLAFLGLEKGMQVIGERELKLNEPSLAKIERDPNRQSELSVLNQVTFLAHQQAHRKPISQEQVMTVILAANPQLNDAIRTRSGGVAFAKLSAQDKTQVLEQLGSQFNIGGLTDGINSHHIRVQELAFTAYGQTSGVERYTSGEAQRAKALQDRIDALEAQLQTQSPPQELNPDARTDNVARLLQRNQRDAERGMTPVIG